MKYLSCFMNRRLPVKILILFTACLAFGGYIKQGRPEARAGEIPVSDVVTAVIQAGIEKHIEKEVASGKGYFNLSFEKNTLRLNLVRVHTEYLAKLGPQNYFACVDLADIKGDVYDVDFFLKGAPGRMTVTETTVHKKNGQPFYAWKQKADSTWGRIPAEKASPRELGIITGKDEFGFLYRATLPELTDSARLWLPLPETDRFQTVELTSLHAPGKQKILKDKNYGNKVLFLELEPKDSGKIVELRYQVQRREKAVYEEDLADYKKYLAPELLVPDNETFRDTAAEVVKGKKSNLVRARAIYDHIIDNMRYMKHGAGWGVGDAVYACDVRTGNCSDFHSYFIALARAVGIPARFAIGAAIPSERNDGGIDGYHCWAEFYTDGKWWPVDISEGDKYSVLATYYFGHNPANRFEFSRGRDLVVKPGPASGPINFLAYPLLEIDGKPVKVKTEFFFKRDGKS